MAHQDSHLGRDIVAWESESGEPRLACCGFVSSALQLEWEESIAEFLSRQTQAVTGTPSTVDTIIKDW